MKNATLPIVLIVLGATWLLNSLHWLPDVHWIWIFGLAGTGLAILVLDGVTKSSIVAGPLLMIGGLLSFLYQYYELGWRFIVPILLISAGVLMLVARSPAIPTSRRFERKNSARNSAPNSAQNFDQHG